MVVGSSPTLGAMVNQELIKESYHLLGKRVELISCTDEYTQLQPGSQGIVNFIDDTGTVFVKWDDGHSLGLIPGIDKWKYIS